MIEKSEISNTAKIYDNNQIINSVIEGGVVIFPNSVIINSVIKENTIVYSSYIEDSEIGEDCVIGPFAHLRPGTKLDNNVKIGNFVEVKKSEVGVGTKISHLTYVGDSVVGKKCNFGCGTITCNYDGVKKHKTIIGDNVFIGSNTNIIAPVEIKDNCFIAAGSTITKSLEENSFAISRVEQKVKPKREKKWN